MIQFTCLGESSEDGECCILKIDNSVQDRPITILYGSILKFNSVLNYLPDHFNITSDEQKLRKNKRFKGEKDTPRVMKGCEDDVYVQKPHNEDYVEYDESEDLKEDEIDYSSMPLGRYGDADMKYAESGIDYQGKRFLLISLCFSYLCASQILLFCSF